MIDDNKNNNGVIYKIECTKRNKIYIGQIGKRIDRHIDTINKNNIDSNLIHHTISENHPIKFNERSIIAKESKKKKNQRNSVN
mgnify:CR=1 FL=1